jgi:hypothetical protein
VAAYEVELTGRARKQYTALDPVIRDRIRLALRDLADDPTPAQVKALTGGSRLLRIRPSRMLDLGVSRSAGRGRRHSLSSQSAARQPNRGGLRNALHGCLHRNCLNESNAPG